MRGNEIFAVVWLIVLAGGYFLPSLVAWIRGHHQSAPIFVINLFLGWTLIGWVVALAWSVMALRPDRR